MKQHHVFSFLQRMGKSFMLPIAVLPVAGIFLGVGSSLTNETTIAALHLESVLGQGTFLYSVLILLKQVGKVLFDNLPLIFAVSIALGMSKRRKEVAALAAIIAFFVMHATINTLLCLDGSIVNGVVSNYILDGSITSVCGMLSLEMGVFGGIVVGLGVSYLHNHFYQIQLPNVISFYEGERFVPIICAITYVFIGVLMYFIWPPLQHGVYNLGQFISDSGYFGTFIYGIIKRSLVPFGLHHVWYMPFYQSALGGVQMVNGSIISGAQNIFFAQLSDPSVTHFSVDATKFFSGEFIFMIFGLPGAALAMYHCAKPEKKKAAGGLLLSAALACMATGITEPLEFSFLFVAPALFVVQVILAGTAYMIAHILNIAVGLTFSGGLLDFFLFGILQGNEKTSWMRVIPVGILYFFLYYFIFKFMIKKFDFKTPGREDDDVETKLYTKADVKARKEAQNDGVASEDAMSEAITKGLGGKKNISDVDCCATRLRCTVHDAARVSDGILKATGASGVVHKGNGVQVIYGPNVTVIKSNLEDYLEKAPNTYAEAENAEAENAPAQKEAEPAQETKEQKVVDTITVCSPMSGLAADLSTAPDEAFAEKMMGDGAVVTPEDPYVRAPEDGEVAFVFDTKHAIGFVTDSGVSLLIHVGIDTVKLNGEGFEALVESGQEVKKGDPMLKLDLEYLKTHAPSVTSPVLCTELEENQRIRLLADGPVKAGDPLFAIEILA